jgi:putative heme degradation protein
MTQTTKTRSEGSINETLKGRWTLNGVPPIAVFDLLPRMDRVMIALRGNQFMHERLGVVDSVAQRDGLLVIQGSEQDITVAYSAIKNVVLDTSTEMRGKAYPKLEFLDADGTRILAITGLEGMPPFETVLAGIARDPLGAVAPVVPSDDPAPDIATDDAGLCLLSKLSEDQSSVQIRAIFEGTVQRWNGVIEKIMPMGGYINVMTKGFHLHLAAGAVARWDTQEGLHRAFDSDDQPIGLEVLVQ